MKLTDKLKDIHLPEPIGFWPPSIALILVASFIALGLLFLGYKFYKNRQKNTPLTEALALLEKYRQQYHANKNRAQIAAEISILLKRVALVYYPQAVTLTAQKWLDFLDSTATDVDFNKISQLLLIVPFKHYDACTNLEPLFLNAQQWIREQ